MQSSSLFHSMQSLHFALSLSLSIYLCLSLSIIIPGSLSVPFLDLSNVDHSLCCIFFYCPSSLRFVLVCLCPVYILSLSLYSLLVSLSYLLYPVPVFAQCQFILFYFCPVSVLSYPASSLSVLFFLVYILSILSLYCF